MVIIHSNKEILFYYCAKNIMREYTISCIAYDYEEEIHIWL